MLQLTVHAITPFVLLAIVADYAGLLISTLQASEGHYLVGCGSADITGPAAGYPIDG